MARILDSHFDPRDVRGVVWDMDGTLYSLSHGNIVERYRRYLADELPPERRGAFHEEIGRIDRGESIFRIGRAVDVENRLVVELDEHGRLVAGWSFDGASVSIDVLRRVYPHGCQPVPNRIFFLGDVWWPTLAAATVAGLGRPALTRAYYRARADQLAEPAAYGIAPVPEVVDRLVRLRERGIGQAIVTNSIAADTERVLGALGLEGIFDHVEVDAKKPEGASDALARVSETLRVPTGALLMVGDNVYFDLLPAWRCGVKTVLVGEPPRAWRSAVHVAAPDLLGALRFLDEVVVNGQP